MDAIVAAVSAIAGEIVSVLLHAYAYYILPSFIILCMASLACLGSLSYTLHTLQALPRGLSPHAGYLAGQARRGEAGRKLCSLRSAASETHGCCGHRRSLVPLRSATLQVGQLTSVHTPNIVRMNGIFPPTNPPTRHVR